MSLVPEEKAYVQAELDALRPLAEDMTPADLAGGGWFARLLNYSLDAYSREVDAAFFRKKYPDLTRDEIAGRRIALAQRYAGLAGGMSASAYTLAVSATLGTAGGASPLALPAAVGTFALDMFFVTRLQLRLAYDLSVIYEHRLSMEDPEDLYELIRVAFGVKAGEAVNNAAFMLAPEAVRVGVKAVASGARLAFLKTLPVVGKYLLQRNIIKFSIPLIGIPLSVGINYASTGAVGRMARKRFRGRAALQEKAAELGAIDHDLAPVLMKVVLLIVRADGTTSDEEARFAQTLISAYLGAGADADAIAEITRTVHLDEDAVFAAVEVLDREERLLVWDAAVAAASVDADAHWRELKLLTRLAPLCGATYDRAVLEAEVNRYG